MTGMAMKMTTTTTTTATPKKCENDRKRCEHSLKTIGKHSKNNLSNKKNQPESEVIILIWHWLCFAHCLRAGRGGSEDEKTGIWPSKT